MKTEVVRDSLAILLENGWDTFLTCGGRKNSLTTWFKISDKPRYNEALSESLLRLDPVELRQLVRALEGRLKEIEELEAKAQ